MISETRSARQRARATFESAGKLAFDASGDGFRFFQRKRGKHEERKISLPSQGFRFV